MLSQRALLTDLCNVDEVCFLRDRKLCFKQHLDKIQASKG
jgi:hypothetical protein